MVETMKQGKRWLPDLFKGVGPKTMEKVAGKAVPFIGPAIDALTAGWEYHKAQRQEEEQANRQRQHLQQIEREVGGLVNQLHDALLEGMEDALSDKLEPLSIEFQNALKTLSGQNASLYADLANLQAVRLRLKQFRLSDFRD